MSSCVWGHTFGCTESAQNLAFYTEVAQLFQLFQFCQIAIPTALPSFETRALPPPPRPDTSPGPTPRDLGGFALLSAARKGGSYHLKQRNRHGTILTGVHRLGRHGPLIRRLRSRAGGRHDVSTVTHLRVEGRYMTGARRGDRPCATETVRVHTGGNAFSLAEARSGGRRPPPPTAPRGTSTPIPRPCPFPPCHAVPTNPWARRRHNYSRIGRNTAPLAREKGWRPPRGSCERNSSFAGTTDGHLADD